MDFNAIATRFSDYHGVPKAICTDGRWVYAVVDPVSGNSKCKILGVRMEDASLTVHALGESDIDTCQDAIVHNNMLILCGTDNGSAVVTYFSLAGDDYPSCATGITAKYEVDDGGTWLTINDGKKLNAGTAYNLSDTNDLTGKRIRFQITGASKTFVTPYYDCGAFGEDKTFLSLALHGTTFTAAGSSATPYITGIVLGAVLGSGSLREIDLVAELVNNPPDKSQAEYKRMINTAATQTAPIKMWDIHGQEMTCRIVPPTPSETIVEASSERRSVEDMKTNVRLLFREVELA